MIKKLGLSSQSNSVRGVDDPLGFPKSGDEDVDDGDELEGKGVCLWSLISNPGGGPALEPSCVDVCSVDRSRT